MSDIVIRRAETKDIEACGQILYESFTKAAQSHGFGPDLQNQEEGFHFIERYIHHPAIYGLVAEQDGKIVGSNFMDENDPIRGIGPLSINPDVQGRGIGRKLMQAMLERGKDAVSIRLLQDAFNVVSFSLYARMNFAVQEPTAVLVGRPKLSEGHDKTEIEVRFMKEEDLPACNNLCRRVLGYERTNALKDILTMSAPRPAFVALRGNQIVAYISAITNAFLNHGVAEKAEDMQDLLVGAANLIEEPFAFFISTRRSPLLTWCLQHGFSTIKLLTLMTVGEYQDPQGPYLPSGIG